MGAVVVAGLDVLALVVPRLDVGASVVAELDVGALVVDACGGGIVGGLAGELDRCRHRGRDGLGERVVAEQTEGGRSGRDERGDGESDAPHDGSFP